jgi:hypothetical protein
MLLSHIADAGWLWSFWTGFEVVSDLASTEASAAAPAAWHFHAAGSAAPPRMACRCPGTLGFPLHVVGFLSRLDYAASIRFGQELLYRRY